MKTLAKDMMVVQLYDHMSHEFGKLIHRLSRMTPEEIDYLESLNRTRKTEGPNDGQYGYYPSYGSVVTIIDKLMKYYDIDGLLDLGSGPGHLTSTLYYMDHRVRGIEIEKSLVNLAPWNANVEQGDILQPIKHIENYGAIYFYEPFTDHDLSKKFVENLEKCMRPHQYIFYSCAGPIIEYLQFSKQFRQLKTRGSVRVYKKLKV